MEKWKQAQQKLRGMGINIPDDIASDFWRAMVVESGRRHFTKDGKVLLGPYLKKYKTRAIGLSQILPETAQRTNAQLDPYNEIDNIALGMQYFSFADRPEIAASPVARRLAYFGGPDNPAVAKYLKTGEVSKAKAYSKGSGVDSDTTYYDYVKKSEGFQAAQERGSSGASATTTPTDTAPSLTLSPGEVAYRGPVVAVKPPANDVQPTLPRNGGGTVAEAPQYDMQYQPPRIPNAFPEQTDAPAYPNQPPLDASVKPRKPIPVPPPVVGPPTEGYRPLPRLTPPAPSAGQQGVGAYTPPAEYPETVVFEPPKTDFDTTFAFQQPAAAPTPAVEPPSQEELNADVSEEGVAKQAAQLIDPEWGDTRKRNFQTVEEALEGASLGTLWMKAPLKPDGTVDHKEAVRALWNSPIFANWGISPEGWDDYAAYVESQPGGWGKTDTPTTTGKYGYSLSLKALNTILWGEERRLKGDEAAVQAFNKDKVHPKIREWFADRQLENQMHIAFQTQRLARKSDDPRVNPFSGMFQGPDWVEEMPDEETYRKIIADMKAREPAAQALLKEKLFLEEFGKRTDWSTFDYWYSIYQRPIYSAYQGFNSFIAAVTGDYDAKQRLDAARQEAQKVADERYQAILQKHGAVTAYHMLEEKLANLPTSTKISNALVTIPRKVTSGFVEGTGIPSLLQTVGIAQAFVGDKILGKTVEVKDFNGNKVRRPVQASDYALFGAGTVLQKRFRDWGKVDDSLKDGVLTGVGQIIGTIVTGGILSRGGQAAKGFLGQADDAARLLKVDDLLQMVKSNPAAVERALRNADVPSSVIERILDPQRFAKLLNAIGQGQTKKVRQALIKGGYGDEVAQLTGAAATVGRTGSVIGVNQIAAEAYNTAIANGATPDQATLTAVLSAPLGLLESVTPKAITERLTRIRDLDKATDGAFSKTFVGRAKELFGPAAAETFKGGGREALTEFLQTLGSNTIERAVTSKLSFEGFAKDLDQALYAGSVGFVVGAVAGAGTEFADRVQRGEIQDPEGKKGGLSPDAVPPPPDPRLLPPAPAEIVEGGDAAAPAAPSGAAPGGAAPGAPTDVAPGAPTDVAPGTGTAAGTFDPEETGPQGVKAGQAVYKTVEGPDGPQTLTGQVSRTADGGWQVESYGFPVSDTQEGTLQAEPWSEAWTTERPITPNERREQSGELEEAQINPPRENVVGQDVPVPVTGPTFEGKVDEARDGSRTITYNTRNARGDVRPAQTEGPAWSLEEFAANFDLDADVQDGWEMVRAEYQAELDRRNRETGQARQTPQVGPLKFALQQVTVDSAGQVLFTGAFTVDGNPVPNGVATFGGKVKAGESIVPPSALQPRSPIKKLSNAAPKLTPGLAPNSIQAQRELVELMLWEATQDYNAAVEDYNAVLEIYRTAPNRFVADAVEAELKKRKRTLSSDEAAAALRRPGTWRDMFSQLEQNLNTRRQQVIDAARRFATARQQGVNVAPQLSAEDADFEAKMLKSLEETPDKDLSVDWVLDGLRQINDRAAKAEGRLEEQEQKTFEAEREAELAAMHPDNVKQLEGGGKPRSDLRVGDPVTSESTGLSGVIVDRPAAVTGPLREGEARRLRTKPMVQITTDRGNIIYRDPVGSDFKLDMTRPVQDLKAQPRQEAKPSVKKDVEAVEQAAQAAKEQQERGLNKFQTARLNALRTAAAQMGRLRDAAQTTKAEWLAMGRKLIEAGLLPKGTLKTFEAASRKKKGLDADVGFAVRGAVNTEIDKLEKIDPKVAAAAKKQRQRQAAEIIAARRKAQPEAVAAEKAAIDEARDKVQTVMDEGGDVGELMNVADKLIEDGVASPSLEADLMNLPEDADAVDIAEAILKDLDTVQAVAEEIEAPTPEAPVPTRDLSQEAFDKKVQEEVDRELAKTKEEPAAKKAAKKPAGKKKVTKAPAKPKAAKPKAAAPKKAQPKAAKPKAAKPKAAKPKAAKPKAAKPKAAKPTTPAPSPAAVSPEQQQVAAAIEAKRAQIAELESKLPTAANPDSRAAVQRKIDFAKRQLAELESGTATRPALSIGRDFLDDILEDVRFQSGMPVNNDKVEQVAAESENFADFAERMNLFWRKVTDPEPKPGKKKKGAKPSTPALSVTKPSAPTPPSTVSLKLPASPSAIQSQGKATKVNYDGLRGRLSPRDTGEFTLVQHPDLPESQAYLVPTASTMKTRSDYLTYYQTAFSMDKPSGGDIFVVAPAIVERRADGTWSIVKKGKLSNSSTQTPTADQLTVPAPSDKAVAAETEAAPATETAAAETPVTPAPTQQGTATPAPKPGKPKGPPIIPGVDADGFIYDPISYNDYLNVQASRIIERGLKNGESVDQIMTTIEREVGVMLNRFHDTMRRYIEIRVDARDNPKQPPTKPLTVEDGEVGAVDPPTTESGTSTQDAAAALTPTQISQIRRLKAPPLGVSNEDIAQRLGVSVAAVKAVPMIPPVGPNGQGVHKIRLAMEEDPDIFKSLRGVFGAGIDFSNFQDGLDAMMDRIAQDPLVNKQRSSQMTAQDWQNILDKYGPKLSEDAAKAILYGVHFQSEWNQAIEKFINDPEIIKLVEGLIKAAAEHNANEIAKAVKAGKPVPPTPIVTKWANVPQKLKDKIASVYERSKFGLTTHPFGQKETLPIISFTQYGVAFDKVVARLMGEGTQGPISDPPVPEPETEVADPEGQGQIVDDGEGGAKAVQYAPNAPVLSDPMQRNKELLVEYPDGTRLYLVGTPTQYPAIPDNVAIVDIFPHGRVSERGYLTNVAGMTHGIGYNFTMNVDGELEQGLVSRVTFNGQTADDIAQELQPTRAFFRLEDTKQDKNGYGTLPSITRSDIINALMRHGQVVISYKLGGISFDTVVDWDKDSMEDIDTKLDNLAKPNTFVSFVQKPDFTNPDTARKLAALHVLQMLPSSNSAAEAIKNAYARQQGRLQKLQDDGAPESLIAKVEAEVDALEKLWSENNPDAFALVPAGTSGSLKVTLVPDPADFLDWNKPWSEQSERVQLGILDIVNHPQHGPRFVQALLARMDMKGWDVSEAQKLSQKQLRADIANGVWDLGASLTIASNISGKDIFEALSDAMPVEEGGMMRFKDKSASDLLHDNGIHGTTFADRLTPGGGGRNFVIFSSADVEVSLFNTGDRTALQARQLLIWLNQSGTYSSPVTIEELGKQEAATTARIVAALEAPAHEVASKAFVVNEDGVITLNIEALALVNAAMRLAYPDISGPAYGMYFNTPAIIKVQAALADLRTGLEASGHWEAADRIGDIYKAFDDQQATPWGDAVVVVDDPLSPLTSAVVREEEMAHRVEQRLGRTADIDRTAFVDLEAFNKAAAKVKELYVNADDAELYVEVIAKAFRSDAEKELGLTADEVFEILDRFRQELQDAGITSSEVAATLRNINPIADRMIANYEQISTDTSADEPGGEAEAAPDDAGRGEGRGEGVEADVRPAEEAPPRQSRVRGKEAYNPARWTKEEKEAVKKAPPSMRDRVAAEIYFAKAAKYEWTVGDVVMDVWSAPKSLASSFDLSAAGRQGLIMGLATARQGFALTAFKRQMASLRSEDSYDQFKLWLQMHKSFELAEAAGLYLANISEEAIGAREEQFMSRLFQRERMFENEGAEKTRRILTFGVQKSEAAYTTYLDSLRIESFAFLAEQINEFNARNGLENRIEDFQALAMFINSATGRGVFRGKLEPLDRAMPVLNAIFFSARYWKSRIDVINPFFYASLPGGFSKQGLFVKRLALAQMGKFMIGAALILALFGLMGAEVEWNNLTDPRFLRVRFGNWSYDFAAGLPQHLRYLNGMIAAATKRPDKEASSDRMMYLTGRYMRGRLSPSAAAVYNYFDETNFIGEPTTLLGELAGLPFPISGEQLYDNMKAEGVVGAAKTIPELFGIGTSRFPLPEEHAAKMRELNETEYYKKNPRARSEMNKAYNNLIKRARVEQNKALERVDPNSTITLFNER